MTSSVITTDAALRPLRPLALHVYESASSRLTELNVRIPWYVPFPKERSDDFEGLAI